jgi:nicotinamidase-related amidase
MNLTAPDFSKSALLTIDMQMDFALKGAVAEIPGTEDVIENNRRIVQAFREAGKPIVHVVRLYKSDGSNVDLCRREMIQGGKRVVSPGSDGAELVSALKPSDKIRLDSQKLLKGVWQVLEINEWIMYKPRWGAFYDTQLEERLRTMGTNTVVVIGCNFPNCPRTTIYEASERDFKIVFVQDAVSQVYDKGVTELKNIGVSITLTDELLDQLKT